MQEYRIVITSPPFSDGFEVTAVRPVRKLTLDDYNLSDPLMKRLEIAEGILIAGAPGMGKSTFAQAIAEYYASLENSKRWENQGTLTYTIGDNTVHCFRRRHGKDRGYSTFGKAKILLSSMR